VSNRVGIRTTSGGHIATDGTSVGLRASGLFGVLDGGISTSMIGQNGATSGQTLVWNGTAWAPATPSSGSGNSTTVDVTTSGDSFASTVVTGQTWVASGSEIVATLMDHPSGTSAEEAIAEGVTVGVGAIVAGTGFTVYLNSPDGGIGPYRVAIVGV
jgi:hypothetical protein